MFDQITTSTIAAVDVDAAAFRKALATLGHVIERRNSIPVLATARAIVKPGQITLTATDLDLELSLTLPAGTGDSMTFLLPQKAFADALAKAKGTASFVTDGASISLECQGGNLETPNPDTPDNFPHMAPFLWQSRAQVPAHDLALALRAVAHCISTEATRYYLGGVYLHGHKPAGDAPAHLRLVSTDGHRLALYDLPMPWAADGAILPMKAVLLLQRLLKDAGTAEIDIAYPADGRAGLFFTGPGWTLNCKVIDGSFPDYTRILPQDAGAYTIILLAADFPKITGKARVALAFDTAEGVMRWRGDDNGAEMSRPVLTEGEATIGFAAQYLAGFLAADPGASITVQGASSGDPARITTADPRFLGVLMPMRV